MGGTTLDPDAAVINLRDHARTTTPAADGRAAADVMTPASVESPELLYRVAMTLNSTLDLRDVLHRLADVALETTGADRCSLFLLEDTNLRSAVALGIDTDEVLWEAFQSMGPVNLKRIPNGLGLLQGLRPVAIENAAASELIPPAWTELFGLDSVVIVPLHAAEEVCGVMVLDYAPRTFTDDELRLLEALAGYAGVAVRNARVHESAQRRARIQAALARGGQELTATTEQSQVSEVLVGAFTQVLGAAGCAIGLFDQRRRRITTVASSLTGDDDPLHTPLPFSEIPGHVLQRLTDSWADERPEPVTFDAEPWFGELIGAGFTRHLVLPLTVQGVVRGAVLLGFDHSRALDAEELSGSRTLAAMGSAVLERSSLTQQLEQNVRRLEVLSAVSAALVDGADADGLVRRLGTLLGGQGIRVVALSLRDPELARAIGAQDPLPEEREISADRPLAVDIGNGLLAVPLLLNDRIVGTLRVQPPDIGEEERAFLEAIGRGVANVITRSALGASVQELALKHAAATVRDVMAEDLHGSIAEYFAAIGLLARGEIERLPDDSRVTRNFKKVARLADGGKWEVDQAVRALAYVPGGDRPLNTALVDLACAFSDDSGIRVLVDVDPVADALSDDVARVLYRVAHEGLVNAWRHGRCMIIRLSVTAEGDNLELRIRDDGVGFGSQSGNRISGVGLNMLRRLLRGVDGDLRVSNARPQGALLVATVPDPAS